MRAMSDLPYLGELEQLLLLAILQCEPGDQGAYTVPIRRELLEQCGRSLSRGALHTALDRLETKGLVSSRMGEPLAMRGGRARRYYTLTSAGLEALRSARLAVDNLSRGLESVIGRR
jgi:PadR family transcriptional regulator